MICLLVSKSINGRSAHVSKLRAEFDTGADYDMTDCDPGDIDPHAAASVFRAFLRERGFIYLSSAILRKSHIFSWFFDSSRTNSDKPFASLL